MHSILTCGPECLFFLVAIGANAWPDVYLPLVGKPCATSYWSVQAKGRDFAYQHHCTSAAPAKSYACASDPHDTVDIHVQGWPNRCPPSDSCPEANHVHPPRPGQDTTSYGHQYPNRILFEVEPTYLGGHEITSLN